MKDNVAKELKIVVEPENVERFINLHLTLKNFSEAGIDVPAAYVTAYLELMYDPEKKRKKMSWDEATKRASIGSNLLTQFKYHLEWVDTVWQEGSSKIKNDTLGVFTELIYAFLLFKKDNDDAGKDDAISFFFQAFDDVYRQRLAPKSRKDFSFRRQAIVSGILAVAAGYKLTSRTASVEDIFQSTRNAIRTYRKE